MSVIDDLKTRIAARISRYLMPDMTLDRERADRLEELLIYESYYDGEQQEHFKVKYGQPDFNIALNFCRLVVDRTVALLVGSGIDFDLPGEEKGPDGKKIKLANQKHIDEVWRANHKDITLHKAAQLAAIYKTGYIKIILDGAESKDNENKRVPRLVTTDPRWMTIVTEAEDIDTVIAYVNEFKIRDNTGKEIKRRETTQRNIGSDGQVISWTVINEKNENGRWERVMDDQEWPYEFAPIIHWKNLPNPNSQYGESDLKDLIALQDRINFTIGNINKIIYHHAHPKTVGKGMQPDDLKRVDAGPDSFWTVNKENADIFNLEMQSDLASSQQFLTVLRQAMFDISRTVDISSMSDKLGALTNFGLRVLYGDALAKLRTKQALFGEMLEELNHRLLVLAGITPSDGGEVVFHDPLPKSETEQVQIDTFELDNKLASRETIATRRGLDYEAEQERISNDQTADDNVGAQALQNFENGLFGTFR